MTPVNCWEYKKCSREPGGAVAAGREACPATTAHALDGLNRGRNGGRVCWAIAGTFCEGGPTGRFAVKIASCLDCDFFIKVQKEEGGNFQGAALIKKAISDCARAGSVEKKT